jgi:hypothetical protein
MEYCESCQCELEESYQFAFCEECKKDRKEAEREWALECESECYLEDEGHYSGSDYWQNDAGEYRLG